MNRYEIRCTGWQTKKALELGEPIEYARVIDTIEGKSIRIPEETGEFYVVPTAEQMLNWLEEQGLELRVIKQRYRDVTFAYVFTMLDNDGYLKPHKNNMVYIVRVKFGNSHAEYFCSSSFNDSLVQAFEYFMGIIENKE